MDLLQDLVKNFRYDATFCLSDTKINGLVWFTISRQHSNEFIITMFYENWDKLAYERSGCLWKLFANWWFYGTGNRNASK